MAKVSYAVDVSGNQPAHQNWRAFGVHMGIAKASEGQRTRDPWFARHIADITAAGLVPGGYHFAWPNQDVNAEAANYVAAVKPSAADTPFVHILDLEPYSEKPGVPPRNYAGRTDAQIRAWATAWIAAVRRAFPGQRVLCYTPRSTAARHYPPTADGYWYPAYPVQGRTFAQAAALPEPAIDAPLWGWQFTSEPRDQTVIYMSPAELKTWAAGASAPAAPEKEEDMPTAADVWNEKIQSGPDKDDPAYEAYRYLRGTSADVKYGFAQVLAQLAASNAALATLAAAIGSGDSVDTIVAAVRQASEEGATAALKGTLTVDVNVHQPDAAPAAG